MMDRSSQAATSLRIVEQFTSIQGEGSLVGVPSRFIRVSGCNLRCHWCDTPESSWAPEGESISIDEICKACEKGPRHVVLTGGEPLLFSPCVQLVNRLRAQGYHITIESAGTRWLEGLSWDLLSLSPKLAHSTPWERSPSLAQRHEAARWPLEVLKRFLGAGPWQLKFVVRVHNDRQMQEDFDEIEAALDELEVREASARAKVYIMPEGTERSTLDAAYLKLAPECIRRGFSLGQRLHIQLWGHCPGT